MQSTAVQTMSGCDVDYRNFCLDFLAATVRVSLKGVPKDTDKRAVYLKWIGETHAAKSCAVVAVSDSLMRVLEAEWHEQAKTGNKSWFHVLIRIRAEGSLGCKREWPRSSRCCKFFNC